MNKRFVTRTACPFSIMHVIELLVVMCAAVGLAACDARIPIPLPDQDQPPIVNIRNMVSEASGEVDQPDVASSSTVLVAPGTLLVVSGSADNPSGGVQRFSITVSQGGSTLHRAEVSDEPDGSGNVAEKLIISGSDGAGRDGSRPMSFRMTTQQARADAIATNFNGMETIVGVIYVPWYRQPLIAFFGMDTPEVLPSPGTPVTLRWTVQNCPRRAARSGSSLRTGRSLVTSSRRTLICPRPGKSP